MAFVFVVPLVFVMGSVIGAFRAFVMGGVTRVLVMGGVIRVFAIGGIVRRQAGMPFGVVLRMLVGGVVVHVHPSSHAGALSAPAATRSAAPRG
ncbi:MAG: hypothetical protein ACE1ZX_02445, partial [Acidimicrobiia bacterium]